MPLTRSRAGMKRAVYETAEHEFAVTLPMGEEVILEMVGPGAPWPAPMHPVVYLDQLHWITLARCLWAPEKLGEADRGAAARLIELARERKICLPFSAGNLTEMTQMDGRHRRHLATTILRLSRGWQMRNPIAIRRGELDATCSTGSPLRRPVHAPGRRGLQRGSEGGRCSGRFSFRVEALVREHHGGERDGRRDDRRTDIRKPTSAVARSRSWPTTSPRRSPLPLRAQASINPSSTNGSRRASRQTLSVCPISVDTTR
jgi:hypothetical protein